MWSGLDAQNGDSAASGPGGSTLRLASLLPDMTAEGRKAALAELQKWTKSLPLARRCGVCVWGGGCCLGEGEEGCSPLARRCGGRGGERGRERGGLS